MGKLIGSLLVLLALLEVAYSLEANVGQDEINRIWNEAAEMYKEYVENCTTPVSRPRRSTRMTPESELMSLHNNIYPFYEKLMKEKHKVSTRFVYGSSTPANPPPPSIDCSAAAVARYRTIDGTCNHLQHGELGAQGHVLVRLLRANYSNGGREPRGGLRPYSLDLPPPRVLSTHVHSESPVASAVVTNMFPQFGQFLDHDLVLTPNREGRCCANPNSDVNCWSISLPTNDRFYSKLSPPQTCLDFTRSTAVFRSGVREQVNMNTAFIDGSQIYGSTIERAKLLRKFEGGLLKTHESIEGFLPTAAQIGLNISGLFAAGDDRINDMPGLVVMHNLFLMEHNRIAKELQRINGSRNDEFLYQETRRIVAALLQNIVYSEFLPILLGPKAMTDWNLMLPASGTYSSYTTATTPSIINSFATAAYRFGHSMVPGVMKLMSATNKEVGSYNLKDKYFQSDPITQSDGEGYDMIMRSLMTQNAPELDRHATEAVSNFLFKGQNSTWGSDLIARNIQRGRDHGIPPFAQFRELCGLRYMVNSWRFKPPEIGQAGWDALRNVHEFYRLYSPEPTIDLFTGGLLETPSGGGLTGPTFKCLIGRQFRNLKIADRYFFTNNAGPFKFTHREIDEIRKQRLSDIICRNSKRGHIEAPLNAFLVTSASNPMVSCGNRTQLDLSVFLPRNAASTSPASNRPA